MIVVSLSFLSTCRRHLLLLALKLSLFCKINWLFNDFIDKDVEDDGESGNNTQDKEDACETLQVIKVEEEDLGGLSTARTHFFLTLTFHFL